MHGRTCRLLVVFGAVALLFAGFAGSASAVTANWTLTVEKNGAGYVSGTGIDCGSDCSESYSNNCAYDVDLGHVVCDPTPATVTASNANGYNFASWTGCDVVNGADCTVDGTTTTVTANFSDVQAPTASLTAPTAGIKAGTINLSATATDNSGQVSAVRFYVRGVQVGTDTTAPYGVSFDSTTVADGSAVVEARAVDAASNVGSPSAATITIDNTAPALSAISGPGAGPFGPSTTQSFSWTASDGSGSGIKSIQCKLDGGAYGPCASSTSASYSNLGDGSHTLIVLVTDNADRTTSRSYTWSIDAVAPTAQITGGPADGSSSTDTAPAFTFTSDEPSSFQCRIYQAALTPPAFEACNGTGSHSVSGLAPGTYAFEVRAVDGVGNTSAAVKRTFTITSPPPVTTTDPGSGSGTPGGGSGTPGGGSDTPAGGTTPTTGPPATAAIAAGIASKWSMKAGKTTAKLLKLTKLPAAATIKVACKAKKGCPFKLKSFKPKAGALDLTKLFRKKALGAGSKLTITITSAGMTGQQIVFITQKKKPPKKSVKPL